MIELEKNKLMEQWLDATYSTFAHTLDTADYVPEKFNEKILKVIYKHSKKSFKGVNRAYREIVRLDRKARKNARSAKVKERMSAKLAKFKRLFKRKRKDAQAVSAPNTTAGD